MNSQKFSKKKITEGLNMFKNNIKINEKKDDDSKSVTNIIEITEEDISNDEDSFVHLKEHIYNKPVDKSQLVEYDLFYKEQFFKNEVFLYDVVNIEDKVEAEIKKEMNRLEIKRKLIEKKKLKEVNDLKKIDTKDLQKEIDELQNSYENCKKKEEPKIQLELNNTEGFLHNGRMLANYLQKQEEEVIPRFAMESEKEIGAKEVIDFKILRKEEVARRYFDYCCCLEERKKVNKALVYARYFCRFFIDNWIFDNFSLLIIVFNTILILISDPTDSNNIGNISDKYFLYFYTVEAILKIISFRFISAEDAYIRDYWNILDFFVVIVGWISFVLERAMNGTKISGLAGLRAFRILRPLKTVKRFKGLKKLVTALLASIGHLGETSIILFFFFLIFAIAGTQMWQGLFYRRCMNVNYGYLVSTQGDEGMCSFDSNCEEYNSYGNTYICAKNFRMKFLFYCKNNGIDEKILRINKCYDVFTKVSIKAKEYIEAYKYCIKSENVNCLFELFDLFEKYCKDKNLLIEDDPFNGGNQKLKDLTQEEFEFLIMRTTFELLMNKKLDIAFDFIGKYYKNINKDKKDENKNIVINFSYSLVCLLIREPKGFDHFWALINLYKGVIEKQYDIQMYLNKISTIYYNKPFFFLKFQYPYLIEVRWYSLILQ